MRVLFFDREDKGNSLNGRAVEESSKLAEILESVRNRTPFFCELVGENGYNLLLGMGKIGCAEYSRDDGSGAYLMAVEPTMKSAEGYIEFLIGGTATPVPARYALPFDVMKQVAVDFLRTGATSQALGWEEI